MLSCNLNLFNVFLHYKYTTCSPQKFGTITLPATIGGLQQHLASLLMRELLCPEMSESLKLVNTY